MYRIRSWTIDARGFVEVRVTEPNAKGDETERTVRLALADVPGAAAAFERLRTLLEERVVKADRR
jgi:hypothetical protein